MSNGPDGPEAAAGWHSEVGEPVRFGVHPADAPHWLLRRGWEVRDLAHGAALGDRYASRWPPDPSMMVLHTVPHTP